MFLELADKTQRGKERFDVFNLVKLFFVVRATNVMGERSASALRTLKTYLRTTMSQERLNHSLHDSPGSQLGNDWQIDHGRYWKSVCFSIKWQAKSLWKIWFQLKLSQTKVLNAKRNWQLIIFYQSKISSFAKLERVLKFFLLSWPQWIPGFAQILAFKLR